MDSDTPESAQSMHVSAPRGMRVLVAWGTKLGGTEGIGRIIGETLRDEGYAVDALPARNVRDATVYDAAIIGGALYANRWHGHARRFIERNLTTLRRIPVWLFSSGPLDESADRGEVEPSNQVAALIARVGARGHVTFGGRLEPDAKGFPASEMAKTTAGDWRNPARIRDWARGLAQVLPITSPGAAIDLPAHALGRLLTHAVVASTLSATVFAILLETLRPRAALALYAAFAPLLVLSLAVHYFRPRGAREALPVAAVFSVFVGLFDVAIAVALMPPGITIIGSIVGIGLALAAIFFITWITGFLMSTMPWPKPKSPPGPAHHPPNASGA